MPSEPPMSSPPSPQTTGNARAISWRSVGVGLLGVIAIAVVTPYNNLIVENTFFIGGTLPIGLVMILLLLVLLVNTPLRLWWPRRALGGAELAVAAGMMLISCSVPATGFVTYVFGQIVGVPNQSGIEMGVAPMLQEMNLPQWAFPVGDRAVAQGWQHAAIRDYVGRLGADEPVPWAVWVRPVLAWTLWGLSMWGAVICFSVIVRRQWAENERLPFPVASIYASLIEPPAEGRALNTLLRARTFWLAFAGVLLLRSWSTLGMYFPKYVPAFSTGIDLKTLFTEDPWRYAENLFYQTNIHFSVIGLTYFIQTRIALSLWLFYVLLQVVLMGHGVAGAEFTQPMRVDQMFGAGVALALMLLWVGRHHLAMVARTMAGRRRPDDPQGRYLGYGTAGWGLVACCAGMVAWLMLAGASLVGSVVLVVMLMWIFALVARIAAETGLYYVQVNVPIHRPWVYALQWADVRTTNASYFWTTFMGAAFAHDTRECASVYATHALRLADHALPESRWKRRGGLVLLLLASLLVSLVVSGGSMVWLEYRHTTTISTAASTPVNAYGVDYIPKNLVNKPTRDYVPPRTGPRENHNRAGHFAFGAALTGTLAFLRLRFEAFPLHPLGFVMAYTFPLARMWLSLMIGWMAKVLVLRLGGSRAYGAARFFFIGLILGEAAAVAFWLVVSLVLAEMGVAYKVLYLTP